MPKVSTSMRSWGKCRRTCSVNCHCAARWSALMAALYEYSSGKVSMAGWDVNERLKICKIQGHFKALSQLLKAEFRATQSSCTSRDLKSARKVVIPSQLAAPIAAFATLVPHLTTKTCKVDKSAEASRHFTAFVEAAMATPQLKTSTSTPSFLCPNNTNRDCAQRPAFP